MQPNCLPRFRISTFLLLAATALVGPAPAQESSGTNDPIARIRDEGFNHSQVMETLTFLCDVIGPRLTASPNHKRANEWTRDKLTEWGLTHAHLEAWGPFGRGWSVKRFSAQVIEPQAIPLVGYPGAWSPGLEAPVEAEVVYLDATNNAGLEAYKGKLKGKIVLASPPREIRMRFEPLASRLADTNLLRLANAAEAGPSMYRSGLADGPPPRRSEQVSTNSSRSGSDEPRRRLAANRGRMGPRFLSFLAKEGAAAVVSASATGDGGTVLVMGVSVPPPEGDGTNRVGSLTNMPRAWSTNAPAIPPQITLAAEDYNRLVQMVQRGEKVKMAVDLQVQFHGDDLMAYNTIADLPGSDLKDEIVMLGGHLDSWHAGTGATDNGIGVAVAMEAVRILAAAGLHPRRTIRIGLWAGEEQGLLGSRAYVAQHLGYYTNSVAPAPLRAPKDELAKLVSLKTAETNAAPTRRLVRLADYEKFSAYFNLDNGAGKIRGIFLQGHEPLRPIFRRWLAPFKDLDAETITLFNTGSTDHTSFEAVGLPGFQFIQDPLDYNSRTHHTNQDVVDRVDPEDAKQAAVIMAAFIYDAAMEDELLPRKPLDSNP